MKENTLKNISCQNDNTSKNLGESYGHEIAMAFYINFHTPKNTSIVSPLNPYEEYSNFQYLLYLNEKGEWKIEYNGCGLG